MSTESKGVCLCPAYRFPHRETSPECHSGKHPLHWSTSHGALSHLGEGEGACDCPCSHCQRMAEVERLSNYPYRAEEESGWN